MKANRHTPGDYNPKAWKKCATCDRTERVTPKWVVCKVCYSRLFYRRTR